MEIGTGGEWRGGEHEEVIDCKGIRGEGEREEGGEGRYNNCW